jgi:hypothetical protein
MATAAQLMAETTEKVHIPFPPIVYGAGAMTIFLVLFAVTWSFRNVGRRH